MNLSSDFLARYVSSERRMNSSTRDVHFVLIGSRLCIDRFSDRLIELKRFNRSKCL